MKALGRLFTAMITPFDAKGAVNVNEAVRLAQFLIDRGNDGLIVAGTTGESPSLETDEKLALFGAIKSALGKRATVIAGTTGNNTRERPAVSALGMLAPVNRGTTRPAAAIQTNVSAPSPTRISQNSSEASLNASRLRPSWMSSVNTGTKAADSAACENRLLNRFGTWEASVKADAAADVLKNAACTTSRPRPAIRDSAVARAKIAVLEASRRRGGGGGGDSADSPVTVLSRDTSAL